MELWSDTEQVTIRKWSDAASSAPRECKGTWDLIKITAARDGKPGDFQIRKPKWFGTQGQGTLTPWNVSSRVTFDD